MALHGVPQPHAKIYCHNNGVRLSHAIQGQGIQ